MFHRSGQVRPKGPSVRRRRRLQAARAGGVRAVVIINERYAPWPSRRLRWQRARARFPAMSPHCRR